MTSVTDICNRALQQIGTRTNVTDAELAASSTNEAKQFNLIYENVRDDLTRMAPWDCALNTANLVYITSQPGTPENTTGGTMLWQKGQPAPPWAYEYQYPVDCLRAVYVIPATQTGQTGSVPITTAVTGGAASWWTGQPVRFKIAVDQFYMVSAAAVVAGGTGYAVGDRITLALQPAAANVTNRIGTFTTGVPQGAAVVLEVATLSGSAVATVNVVNQIAGSATRYGGSYFYKNASTPATQASTTGSGSGATFTLTWVDPRDQRVLLTNQEYATLNYCKQVTDPNVMDTLFQSAWIQILAGNLAVALTGDKQLANLMIQLANNDITEARKSDGNEGLTVNDVTPDWMRIRGTNFAQAYSGPYGGFDWSSLGLWPLF